MDKERMDTIDEQETPETTMPVAESAPAMESDFGEDTFGEQIIDERNLDMTEDTLETEASTPFNEFDERVYEE